MGKKLRPLAHRCRQCRGRDRPASQGDRRLEPRDGGRAARRAAPVALPSRQRSREPPAHARPSRRQRAPPVVPRRRPRAERARRRSSRSRAPTARSPASIPGQLAAMLPAPEAGRRRRARRGPRRSGGRDRGKFFTDLGIEPDDAIHVVRALRSYLHGFVDLERRGGFGMRAENRTPASSSGSSCSFTASAGADGGRGEADEVAREAGEGPGRVVRVDRHDPRAVRRAPQRRAHRDGGPIDDRVAPRGRARSPRERPRVRE